MAVTPYIFFDGKCEEALEFYKQALGAEVQTMMRFSDSPEPDQCVPGQSDKIMHADFTVGDAMIMASDGECKGKPDFRGISLALDVATPEEAERLFNALAQEGQDQMPMTPTFFSPMFGMVADKFGLSWMIMARPAEQ